MAAAPLNVDDIELSTRAGEHFHKLYYASYDGSTRAEDLPKFYRDGSTVTWNGKPYQGAKGVKELMEHMPATKHEVRSFDCHPIPGSQPPSLLITISGTVVHGKIPDPPPAPPRGKAPPPPLSKEVRIQQQPRVFSQTFVLVPDPTAPPTKQGEIAKYFVSADSMRFVG